MHEFLSVTSQKSRVAQADVVTILWKDVFPEHRAEPVERLAEGVPGLVFWDLSPKETDELVTARGASDRDVSEYGKRLPGPKPGKRAAVLSFEGRYTEQLQLETTRAGVTRRSLRGCFHGSQACLW
jgi:hypothetical protein